MNGELPRTLKIATLWLLVGLVVFLGIQWRQQRASEARFSAAGNTVEIRRGADGHYHWPGSVNGRKVQFLVDTGATRTAISTALAAELGLQTLGRVDASTAGGTVSGEQVSADIVLEGGVSVERLRVVALPIPGDSPLLGMDVLGRLHLQQQAGVLRVEPSRGPP